MMPTLSCNIRQQTLIESMTNPLERTLNSKKGRTFKNVFLRKLSSEDNGIKNYEIRPRVNTFHLGGPRQHTQLPARGEGEWWEVEVKEYFTSLFMKCHNPEILCLTMSPASFKYTFKKLVRQAGWRKYIKFGVNMSI